MRTDLRLGKSTLWLLVATIALLTGASTLLSVRYAAQSNDRVTDTALERAETAAAGVDEYLAQRIGALEALAIVPVIARGTPAEQDAFMAVIDEATLGFGGGLGLVTLDGVMTAWTAAPSPEASVDVSARSYVQAVRESGQPFIGEAVATRPSNFLAIPVAVPIRGDGASIVGILVGAIRLDAGGQAPLLRLLSERTTVVDRAGQVVVERDAIAELRSVVDQPAYVSLRETPSGVDEDARNLSGERNRLVSHAATARGGWLIVIDQPRDEAFGSARRQLVEELVVKGLISALALVGGVIAARRLDRAAAAERRSAAVAAAQTRVLERIALRAPLAEVEATIRDELEPLYPGTSLGRELGMVTRAVEEAAPADQPMRDDRLPFVASEGSDVEGLRVAAHLMEIAVEQDRSARARDESERQVRRLVDSNILGVYTARLDGAIVDANERFLAMLGYSREDLRRGLLEWSAATPPEWADDDAAAVESLRRAGVCTAYEKEFLSKDGSRVPVLAGAAMFGHEICIAYSLDLTELKRAQADTVQSEQRYRALVEASSAAVWRFVPGTPLGESNPWYLRLTGQTAEELDGSGWLDAVHPDDRGRASEVTATAIREGVSFAADYRVRSAAGTYRHLAVRGVPLPTADGQQGEWIGTYSDVTEEKAQAQALRISEERQRLALDAADLGAWDWELATGKVTWSPVVERHLGLEPGSFPGTIEAFRSFVHPEDRELVEVRVRAALEEGAPYAAEFRMIRVDGSIKWTRTSGRVITDGDGNAVRLVGIEVDTTDERAAQTERQLFLASVAHDLKNPIAVLKASAQLLQRKAARGLPLEPEEARARLAVIEANAARLARRLDDLSDLSQLEAGLPVDLDVAQVDLVQLVTFCVEAARRVTVAHNLRLALPPYPVIGWWDAGRIERVIDNLIGNAVKYSPAGGEIVVRVWRDEASVYVSVQDYGIGIPSAEREAVFAFRRRGSNVGEVGGSGVGLAGASRLVELGGGEISLTSEEGVGSTFVVRLPLRSPDPSNGDGAAARR